MGDASDPLSRLIRELERLPGVGPRTAERLAYHLLKSEPESALRLASAIRELKEKLKPCPVCFNVSDGGPCPVCRNPERDATKLCVVEQPKDLVALEKSGAYTGVYHVLLGRISPHEGAGADKLTLPALRRRLDDPECCVREIIIATNPDTEGDATALVVMRALADLKGRVEVTRLARGLPSGSTLDYANVDILKDAFDGRRRV